MEVIFLEHEPLNRPGLYVKTIRREDDGRYTAVCKVHGTILGNSPVAPSVDSPHAEKLKHAFVSAADIEKWSDKNNGLANTVDLLKTMLDQVIADESDADSA